MQRRGDDRFRTTRAPRLRGPRAGLAGGPSEPGPSACARDAALLLYEAVLPAVPLCVGRIRRELDDALAGVDVPAPRRRDIGLAITEAATNSVLHAYGGSHPGPLYVAASVSGRSVMLTVSDCGRGMQAALPGGAGLSLIGRVADALRITGGPVDRGTRLSIVFRDATPPPATGPLADRLHDGIPARADGDVLRDYADALAGTGAPGLDGAALEREGRRALEHVKRSRRRAWMR